LKDITSMSLKGSRERELKNSKLLVGSKERSAYRTLTELARLQSSDSGALVSGNNEAQLRVKEKNAREKLKELHQKFELDSHIIIFDVMPAKIKHLDDMFKNDPNFNTELETVAPKIQMTHKDGADHPDPTTSIVECNSIILNVENALKMEILEMKEYMNTLQIWVQLNIPRIQDGNNFGVEVQSEIVSVLEAAGDSGLDILAGFTDYHLTRAALLIKSLKYPGIRDYTRAITELDERFYIKTTSLALDLRNAYFVLFDSISKNLAKIETPRPKEEPTFIY